MATGKGSLIKTRPGGLSLGLACGGEHAKDSRLEKGSKGPYYKACIQKRT